MLASLFFVEGILNIALFFQVRSIQGSAWLLIDGINYVAIRTDDLDAMANELRVGDRHTGRREHDHQRRHACDAVIGVRKVADTISSKLSA